MQSKSINPFYFLAEKHSQALDELIATLPANPTFEQFNQQLTDIFFLPDPADPSPLDLIAPFLRSILPSVFNTYVNHSGSAEFGLSFSNVKYSEKQLAIIYSLMKSIGSGQADKLPEIISGFEAQIAAAELSFSEQAPLFLAAALGKTDAVYWLAQINSPGAWSVYLNANPAIGYMNLNGIVWASVFASLSAYGFISQPQIQFANAFSSLLASTGLPAGKVIFGWVAVPGS